MNQYDSTNRWSIWPNKNKRKDTDPDYTGSINVDGVEHWINAWKRKPGSHHKAPVLSGTIRPKQQVHDDGMAQAKQAAGFEDLEDSDIPF